MVRLILSLVFFAGLSIGVGFLLSGDDQLIDWLLAGGLFGIALAGELTRLKIRRSRIQTAAAGQGKNQTQTGAAGRGKNQTQTGAAGRGKNQTPRGQSPGL